MQNTEEIWRLVDAKQDAFNALSDRVWGMPELCYGEFRSCAEHTAMLEQQGFRVTKNVAGIPTAVMGEAGEDGPVIAILGEYDALPGLSQEAGVAEHRPLPGAGYGHGCGHNLLGSGVAAGGDRGEGLPRGARASRAACATTAARPKKAARPRASWCAPARSTTWTSRSPGIPAAFCRRQRADVAGQHAHRFLPSPAAPRHAAAAPHLGRSALDAVELMNVGVNYMREHMPSDARIHYALLDAGGIAPNVVQAFAKVRYLIRARDLPELNRLIERVRKIADGAALMTETSGADARWSARCPTCWATRRWRRRCTTICERLGPPPFDDADRAFAGEDPGDAERGGYRKRRSAASACRSHGRAAVRRDRAAGCEDARR